MMGRRRPQVPVALGKAAGYLMVFLGIQIVVQLCCGDTSIQLILLSNLLTLGLVLLFYLIRRNNLSQALWLRPVSGAVLCSGISVALMLYLVVAGVLTLLPEGWLANYSEASSGLEDTGLLAVLSIVVAAPVVEEVIFRGLMLNRLAGVMPGWLAVLVSAGIFGICHGEPVWICYAFVLGMVFGLMDVRANSMLPSLLAHVVFNGANQVIATADSLLPETGGMIALTMIGVLSVVLLGVNRRAVAAIFCPAQAGAMNPQTAFASGEATGSGDASPDGERGENRP